MLVNQIFKIIMTLPSAKYNNLLSYTLYYSVATALTICIIKIYSWYVTNSVSILATLIDSMLDIAASVINLLAMRYALMPPRSRASLWS